MSRSMDFSFYVMGVRQIMFMGIMPMRPHKKPAMRPVGWVLDFDDVSQAVAFDGDHVRLSGWKTFIR
ncbi:MAG: hypothetical protein ACFNUL_06590 [Cardiobacterium hominis]